MPRFSAKDDPQGELNTQAWIKRVRSAGAELFRRGIPIGRYFADFDDGSVATQRDTKDHLHRRLKAAAAGPQVVTVQPRGGEKGGAYVIVPLDTLAEALEARASEERFVPITASLREIGGNLDLPVLKSRGSGRRLRTSTLSVPMPLVRD